MPSPVILSAVAGALTFVAFIAAPSAAAAGEPAAPASASPPDGKMIFEIGCALCHSLNPPAKKAPPISHAASYYLRRHGSEEAAVQAMVAFLQAPSAATKVSYLKEMHWSEDKLINGANGIAALTFCDVPIAPLPAAKQGK